MNHAFVPALELHSELPQDILFSETHTNASCASPASWACSKYTSWPVSFFCGTVPQKHLTIAIKMEQPQSKSNHLLPFLFQLPPSAQWPRGPEQHSSWGVIQVTSRNEAFWQQDSGNCNLKKNHTHTFPISGGEGKCSGKSGPGWEGFSKITSSVNDNHSYPQQSLPIMLILR